MTEVNNMTREEAAALMFGDHLSQQAEMVTEFNTVFDTKPTPELSALLVREELAEVREAGAHLLKEMVDLMYVVGGAGFHGHDLPEEVVKEIEAVSYLGDLFGAEQFMEAFRRVHMSNMSKVGDDGKPLRREDGKVLKGPNYKLADLSDLIG